MYSPEILAAISDTENFDAILAFNKTGGELVFCVYNIKMEEMTPHPHLVFVEEQFNQNTQEIVGTYPDYKIVEKADLGIVVHESTLDSLMAAKITKQYPIAEQVNVLGRAIEKLAKEHNIVLDELAEMLDYIQLARETNREQKASYAADPAYRYISNADTEEKNMRLYAGGLHEALGPRQNDGGRVFH